MNTSQLMNNATDYASMTTPASCMSSTIIQLHRQERQQRNRLRQHENTSQLMNNATDYASMRTPAS